MWSQASLQCLCRKYPKYTSFVWAGVAKGLYHIPSSDPWLCCSSPGLSCETHCALQLWAFSSRCLGQSWFSGHIPDHGHSFAHISLLKHSVVTHLGHGWQHDCLDKPFIFYPLVPSLFPASTEPFSSVTSESSIPAGNSLDNVVCAWWKVRQVFCSCFSSMGPTLTYCFGTVEASLSIQMIWSENKEFYK